uniref:Uncharacterized protein n=1 Tax=Rhizophora mucronata TaxID=61149 RepID=A0A2P2NK31_RHIMU
MILKELETPNAPPCHIMGSLSQICSTRAFQAINNPITIFRTEFLFESAERYPLQTCLKK